MAADEADIVAERQQFRLDRRDQRRMAAAGQIGAADRAVEQHVADIGEAHVPVEEHHAARRVPRTVKNLEGEVADLYGVAFVEPAVGRDVAHAGDAEARAAAFEIVEQRLVGDVRSLDRHAAELFLQLGRTARVIEMAVRQPDLLDRDAGLRNRLKNIVHVAARIDDDGALGRLAPDQCAVLLERGDGNDDGPRLWRGGLAGRVLGIVCHIVCHGPHMAHFRLSGKGIERHGTCVWGCSGSRHGNFLAPFRGAVC